MSNICMGQLRRRSEIKIEPVRSLTNRGDTLSNIIHFYLNFPLRPILHMYTVASNMYQWKDLNPNRRRRNGSNPLKLEYTFPAIKYILLNGISKILPGFWNDNVVNTLKFMTTAPPPPLHCDSTTEFVSSCFFPDS